MKGDLRGNAVDHLGPFVLSYLDLLNLRHRYYALGIEIVQDDVVEASVILLGMAWLLLSMKQ